MRWNNHAASSARAPPRLAAIEAFDREFPNKIFRYVNNPDPVPKLPLMSLMSNQYGHCQKEIGLGEAVATTGSFFGDVASKTVDGVLNATIVDDIWSALKGRIGAHGMDNCRTLVGKLFK